MINLSLNPYDFTPPSKTSPTAPTCSQHVWSEIVYKFIPQMSEADLDFFWYIFRRDFWEDYFYKTGLRSGRCGAEDYLHALAALHRGNRSYVRYKSDKDGKTHIALCYTFQSKLCPLYLDRGTTLEPFDRFIPGEQVLKQTVIPMPVNKNVEVGKEEWWEDLSIYNKKIRP